MEKAKEFAKVLDDIYYLLAKQETYTTSNDNNQKFSYSKAYKQLKGKTNVQRKTNRQTRQKNRRNRLTNKNLEKSDV